MKRIARSRHAGLIYMLAATFLFSLMSLQVKLAGERLPPQQIVLARSLVSLVLSFAWLRAAGLSPWGTRKGLLLLRGGLGFVALSLFFFALTRLPLAEATVIQHTNPLFTALLAAFFLAEGVRARELLATLGSLLGVLLVARPAFVFGDGSALSPVAVAAALLSAVLAAAAYTVVRKLGSSEHPLVIVLWFPMVAVPASLPLVLPTWVWPSPFEWVLLLGVGVATQVAQVLMTLALRVERAGRATSYGYVQVVFAALWGWWVFGELPPLTTAGGAVLIVLCAVWLATMREPRMTR